MSVPNHPGNVKVANKDAMVQLQCKDRNEKDAKTLICQNNATTMQQAAACRVGDKPHFRPRTVLTSPDGSGSGSATGSGSGS